MESEAPREVKKEIEVLRTRGAVDKACRAVRLGEMGPTPKGAIHALIKTFKDRTALERRLHPGAVPVDGTSPAEEAAKALGKIGKEALEPLIKALGDKDSDVRLEAALALKNITGKDSW